MKRAEIPVFPCRPDVKVWTRHLPGCTSGNEKDRCPKQFYVSPFQLRLSARTNSWKTAEKRAEEFAHEHDPAVSRENKNGAKVERRRIVDVLDAFLLAKQNAKEARAADDGNHSVRTKHRNLKKKLLEFLAEYNRERSEAQQIDYLDQITTDWLEEKWRPTWPHQTYWSKTKFLELVISFFKWCVERGWITVNPAKTLAKLERNKESKTPTPPFTDAQYAAILEACSRFDQSIKTCNRTGVDGKGQRLRALIQVMRFAGVRISDASLMERDAIGDDGRWERAALKNGKLLNFKLPADVVAELRALPEGTNPRYFFWSGKGTKQNAADPWQRDLARLWKLIDPPLVCVEKKTKKHVRPHSHMFRNTFAVKCRLAGMSWETIAALLGDDVQTVKDHYAPETKEVNDDIDRQLAQMWEPKAPANVVVMRKQA
jgi:integrase/recombinase XerD